MSKIVPEEERLTGEEIAQLPKATSVSQLMEIRLSGVGKTKQGDLVRTNFLKSLVDGMDDYTDVSFTPEEAKRVTRHLSSMRTGAATALPRICNGEKCYIKEQCVFWQMGRAPVGRKCLLEVQLLQEWRMWYLEEYSVDPSSFTEVSVCNELAEIELLSKRINDSLAKPENAELLQENVVAVDREGNPVYQKQVSPLIEAKEKLLGRKIRLINMMVGDRKEKYKREAALKIRESRDPSESMSAIRAKLERLQRSVEHAENQTVIEVRPEEPLPQQQEPKIITPEDLLGGEE